MITTPTTPGSSSAGGQNSNGRNGTTTTNRNGVSSHRGNNGVAPTGVVECGLVDNHLHHHRNGVDVNLNPHLGHLSHLRPLAPLMMLDNASATTVINRTDVVHDIYGSRPTAPTPPHLVDQQPSLYSTLFGGGGSPAIGPWNGGAIQQQPLLLEALRRKIAMSTSSLDDDPNNNEMIVDEIEKSGPRWDSSATGRESQMMAFLATAAAAAATGGSFHPSGHLPFGAIDPSKGVTIVEVDARALIGAVLQAVTSTAAAAAASVALQAAATTAATTPPRSLSPGCPKQASNVTAQNGRAGSKVKASSSTSNGRAHVQQARSSPNSNSNGSSPAGSKGASSPTASSSTFSSSTLSSASIPSFHLHHHEEAADLSIIHNSPSAGRAAPPKESTPLISNNQRGGYGAAQRNGNGGKNRGSGDGGEPFYWVQSFHVFEKRNLIRTCVMQPASSGGPASNSTAAVLLYRCNVCGDYTSKHRDKISRHLTLQHSIKAAELAANGESAIGLVSDAPESEQQPHQPPPHPTNGTNGPSNGNFAPTGSRLGHLHDVQPNGTNSHNMLARTTSATINNGTGVAPPPAAARRARKLRKTAQPPLPLQHETTNGTGNFPVGNGHNNGARHNGASPPKKMALAAHCATEHQAAVYWQQMPMIPQPPPMPPQQNNQQQRRASGASTLAEALADHEDVEDGTDDDSGTFDHHNGHIHNGNHPTNGHRSNGNGHNDNRAEHGHDEDDDVASHDGSGTSEGGSNRSLC